MWVELLILGYNIHMTPTPTWLDIMMLVRLGALMIERVSLGELSMLGTIWLLGIARRKIVSLSTARQNMWLPGVVALN